MRQRYVYISLLNSENNLTMKVTKFIFYVSVAGAMLAGCKKDTSTPPPTITEISPTITGFSPVEARHSAMLTITGENFSAVPSENSVTFNGVPAAIISAIPTEIKVTVPKNVLCSGPIRVTVAGKTAISTTAFNYLLTAAVSTLAGSGTAGFANETGAAAQFNYPRGVAVDASGNVYVADVTNNRIRKISSAGKVTTLAGSGTSGNANGTGVAAQFNFPYDVAIDASGNVYVTDYMNDRIRKITPAGVVTTFAGGSEGFADGTGAAAQFNGPIGIALDASGNLFVADYWNNRIRKITSAGVVTTFAGSTEGSDDGTGTAAKFNLPCGIAVDASGNMYVADRGNNRIRKITSSGVVTTLAGSTKGFADGTGTAAKFDSPAGIAVDASGNVYVGDEFNHRIRKITSTGVVSTFVGNGTVGFTDGAGATVQFQNPFGVTLDASGNLYVGDTYNHSIRKIVME